MSCLSGFRFERKSSQKRGIQSSLYSLLGVASAALLSGGFLGGCVLSRPLPERVVAVPAPPPAAVAHAEESVTKQTEGSEILSSGAASEYDAATTGTDTGSATQMSREQVLIRLRDVYSSLESALRFETGDATVSSDARDRLQEFARLLKQAPDLRIRISGFADSLGDSKTNLALSVRRADAVRAVLMEAGVGGSQLRVEGMGEKAPIASNRTPDGRSLNRRVEIETPAG